MGIKVQGERKLVREIANLRRRLRLAGGDFADLAAGTIAATVVRNTQPFGNGKAALAKQERAIRGDLLQVMRPVGEGTRGNKVIRSVAEAKRWHQSRRGSRGRTRGGERRLVLASVFRTYLAQVQSRAGMAKGSVSGGGDRRLGARFARWVARHKEVGKSRRRRGVGGATWKFEANPVHVASSRVLGERGVSRVMRQKEKNLYRVLDRKVRREMKKAERRVNR